MFINLFLERVLLEIEPKASCMLEKYLTINSSNHYAVFQILKITDFFFSGNSDITICSYEKKVYIQVKRRTKPELINLNPLNRTYFLL